MFQNLLLKKDKLANLERIIIEHELEVEEAICNKCDNILTFIGKKSSKEILKYVPTKLYIEEHITYSYACKPCEETSGDTNIITTKAPNTVLYKSMASNELIAHMIIMKYQHAIPLYRKETYFKMLGSDISRQTMYNLTIAAAFVLQGVYDILQNY